MHKGKLDTYNTLPDIACVRDNHKLLSLYCEKRIAEEMLEKNVSCRTSRQDVGRMAGAIIKVGDRMRDFKAKCLQES